MPNQYNQDQVAIVTEKLSRAKSMAVVDYSGVNVSDMTRLRKELKAVDGEFFVTKNTLIDIATGKGKLTESLEGMNALVFSYKDAVAGLKKLFSFQKETEKLTIKQGLLLEDDKVLAPDEVKALSQLPSKEELISALISRIQGPIYGLANVLKANQRNLVYALKAIAEKQQ